MIHLTLLYLVTFGLVIYGLRKDTQLKREKRFADIGRSVVVAEMINKGLRRRVAEAKGMTEEEFNKAWEAKWTNNK